VCLFTGQGIRKGKATFVVACALLEFTFCTASVYADSGVVSVEHITDKTEQITSREAPAQENIESADSKKAGSSQHDLKVNTSQEPNQSDKLDCQEMQQLEEADQKDRAFLLRAGSKDWNTEEMQTMASNDVDRRIRTAELFSLDSLHTANDYYNAAMIMQHGDRADDFLKAHLFATLSLKLGRPKSAWLAAVSLDRYLMKIGQPQVFGSQFNNPDPKDASKWTMDPFNEKLLSDSLRKEFFQLSVDDAKERLEHLKKNEPIGSTH
jgi:hypothetical protein